METSEQAVAAVGGLILRCAFAKSGMMVRYGVTMGAATVGDGSAEGGLILRSELAVGDIILRGGYAVAVIILLISPTTRSARFLTCIMSTLLPSITTISALYREPPALLIAE
jgi:hypothetical protein